MNVVLPRNCSKRGLVCTKYVNFRKAVFHKKSEKLYYTREFILFSAILNHTIPGIVLSETVLSGDPQYLVLGC